MFFKKSLCMVASFTGQLQNEIPFLFKLQYKMNIHVKIFEMDFTDRKILI